MTRLLTNPVLLVYFVASTSAAFGTHSRCLQVTQRTTQRQPTAIFSILDDIKKSMDEQQDEKPAFNPLNYSKQGGASSVISLRKTTMTELLNELLNTNDDLEPILNQYKDFLLEPLDDTNAVLETDSIYTPAMSREERYQAYRTNMEGRVSQAKNAQVKKVLTAMKDFVLQFE